jgi:hypothetical protein
MMAHVHNEECKQLHEALHALQAQQQAPRSSMSAFAGQMVSAERSVEPEGDSAGVEEEIEHIRRALDALGCDR